HIIFGSSVGKISVSFRGPDLHSSALSARSALLAVGCRLSIHPTRDAPCEAARCHSVETLRDLLVRVYGELGLAIAYQLAGREQPLRGVSSREKGGDAMPGPPALLSPEVLRCLPLQVARFFLHEPRNPPRWRTSLPPDGMGRW